MTYTTLVYLASVNGKCGEQHYITKLFREICEAAKNYQEDASNLKREISAKFQI